MGFGKSYLINAGLACGVLYFVLDLSRSGRGPVDWVVISAVAGVISWNLFHLAMRLHAAGGGKEVWHLIRTLTFWLVGLINTAFSRPEDQGSWRTWIGWAFLTLALLDSLLVYRTERATISPDQEGEDRQASSPAQHQAPS